MEKVGKKLGLNPQNAIFLAGRLNRPIFSQLKKSRLNRDFFQKIVNEEVSLMIFFFFLNRDFIEKVGIF